MKKMIWMSFDLGIRGDYEGMYEFLDNHGAKDCGAGVAAFPFEFNGDLVAALKKEITEQIRSDRRTRIYAIFPGPDGKYKGRFVVGKRKSPPWSGFGAASVDEEDSGE